MDSNPLIIIGGGAAGLMAAAVAGEAGLPAMLLERRHRPGLKLLMCGNNRCNISHGATAGEMAQSYGGEIGRFLSPALKAFPPSALRAWFSCSGLQTVVKRNRIYPQTENADDVLHCFLDKLRDLRVPLVLNCPVAEIVRQENGYKVIAGNGVGFTASNVLIATGGVSYPKTGSVGDGQRFASQLGHKVTPLRAGLAGMEVSDEWLSAGHESDLPDVEATLYSGDEVVARTSGNVLCAGGILRGTAIFDASRIIAHRQLRDFTLSLDLFPGIKPGEMEGMCRQARGAQALESLLVRLDMPGELAAPLARGLVKWGGDVPSILKDMPVHVTGIRPLKEAIVTVGGVSLDQIDPETMESRICPGLYFAGEVMDVDGPTGGYNLHAAFATARLAVDDIVRKCGNGIPRRPSRPLEEYGEPAPRQAQQKQSPRERYGDPRTSSRPFRSGGRNNHGKQNRY